ncbi:MAG TPA: PEP/pyruvate-binding domain-containing protein, partial [Candidatus Melainabacteria bacterium]|nr:PEP/pyruvate-binding domain-containing protein [Candidatus Melainabacteria bacterium]
IFSVGDYLLAVRSSAIDEDGEITSFAGQLDSFLNVKSDMVITAAKSVWLSGSSERLKSYCQKLQIDKQANGPAVIVQKMVDAKIAGVAFSADPVSGARDTVVISAVNGLADRLVSGEVPGDLLYVLNGREIKRAACVGEKSVINDELAIEIAHAARKIETLFSCPQDIEWAHDGKQLFILQARPITNLPDPQKCQDGNLRIWDNSNISESYQGVTTPLTFSFASKAYKHVYIHFCRLMGVSDKRIRDNQQIFPSMLGFIRGRIYYNLVNWYRLLALLPGFQVNRPFMEQMMGVKEELPPEVIEQVLKDNKTPRLPAYKDFGVSLLAMLVRFANLKREIETFQNHFETTLDEVPKDLSSLNTDQLAKLYRSLEDRLLSSWDAPLVNDFFAMVFFGLLNSLSIKWIKSKTFSHHELLVQSGGIISAQPVEMIEAMATIAQSDPQLQSSLRTGSLAQIEKAVKENLKFETALKNYLERFGDRCFNELKLESPTLKDDPLPLLRNIGHMEFLPERKSFRNRKENREAREAISELPLAQ